MKNEMQCERCHRISEESDCNNLQCPYCGGNIIEYEPEPEPGESYEQFLDRLYEE